MVDHTADMCTVYSVPLERKHEVQLPKVAPARSGNLNCEHRHLELQPPPTLTI